LNVSAGLASQSFIFDTASTTKTNMGWENHHFFFTATNNTTSLIFSDIFSHTNSGSALDNIIVSTTSEVPEPASLLLLITGMIGFASTIRRKK